MYFKIMTPNRIIDECNIKKVTAQGREGSFTVLPRHVDFISILIPSIVTAVDEDDVVRAYAVDGGIVTKEAETIRITTPLSVQGESYNENNPEEGIAEKVRRELEKQKKQAGKIETESIRKEIELVLQMVESKGGV